MITSTLIWLCKELNLMKNNIEGIIIIKHLLQDKMLWVDQVISQPRQQHMKKHCQGPSMLL